MAYYQTPTVNLTQTERWFIGEHLRAVQNCTKKCNFYSGLVQDSQLKQIVSQCAQMCQQHVNTLQALQRGTGWQQPGWQQQTGWQQQPAGFAGFGGQAAYGQQQ